MVQAACRQSAVPRSHRDRVDVAQVHVGEHGDDVTELALVDLTRPRTHRALGDPPGRVLPDRDLAGVGVNPLAAHQVGLDGGEPASRVGLAGEGRVGRDLFPEVPVARLVAAAGQLADVAEGTGSGHGRLLVLGANSVGTCRHDGPWDPSALRSPGQDLGPDLGFRVERTTGIEPASSAWKAAQPLIIYLR